MHIHKLEQWQHGHNFFVHREQNEKNTQKVMGLTAVTMVIEIVAGVAFGSMALLADGWHMGTHVAAFLITLFAYSYSRKNANNPDFTFGPGKINVLGGFASAVALAVVALIMAVESVGRFFSPVEIHYGQSILVAVVGLVVNVVSAFLLHGSHGHDHHHGHSHGHENHHEDHNLKAAYFHVLADALTSVLAIVALLFGSLFGWWALDPGMGIVGALVITRWAWGLLKESSAILLDAGVKREVREEIKDLVEADADNRVTDIHVWKVGPHHLAALLTLVTHYPRSSGEYKKLLAGFDQLKHITIEVIKCEEEPCIALEEAV
ncbi:MAG: CDF family Co(II)/Ni(II) efflux transporter DmeF [Desulfuromonadales bacterium]|jgi:cation diffusion facilitator family transporter|nr:CDF family Co(II)/Ni(II) efflux transporter DmeF [Desulfuromonadales bacterium]MDH3868393.1 CDF family Co(II)/Ni(II) efflux transporter DmeF [Desulfuromonadales bacterium]MDH3959772.1 CDF family Co(II)/Ni(II) efflux transporter DmeF [Desulfuromonadales bacterium]MDH4024247.1 CDF family Co(II)/Ni(II) efflux transporter DmeF [Desulfuromonadales bacterium]